MPRLFTGLELPRTIVERLSLIRAGLTGARWITPDNYHITLRFAGDITEGEADEFAYALESVRMERFVLRLNGLGSFGGHKPRALIANIEGGEALKALCRANEAAARIAGLEAEGRHFIPHVTLARLTGTPPDEVARFLENFGDFSSEAFEVKRFVLFSSRPSRGGGPYAVEASYPLEENYNNYEIFY